MKDREELQKELKLSISKMVDDKCGFSEEVGGDYYWLMFKDQKNQFSIDLTPDYIEIYEPDGLFFLHCEEAGYQKRVVSKIAELMNSSSTAHNSAKT
jgi:hypothetical protein